MHDVANDLGALKLLLIAISMATDDEERSRHVSEARRLIVEGEGRVQALRQAVQLEVEAASSRRKPDAAKARTRRSKLRPKR